MRMISETKCVFYAYPTSHFGGKNGGWISARYKNVLAIDPMESFFFSEKDSAIDHAEKTWDLPWDKYRSAV